MEFKIIAAYVICDDILKVCNFKDDPQCRMTTAEVMTLGITSTLFYGGNIQQARRFFFLRRYTSKLLTHSRILKRLLVIPDYLWQAALWFICRLLSYLNPSTKNFIVDSCPIQACLPCRSWRCKLYKGTQYLGYCAAKKLFYYGLKLHLIIDEYGVIHEFLLTPASWADIKAFKEMEVNLPEESYLFGDRAYNSLEKEAELKIDGNIQFTPQRKRKSKRQYSGTLKYLQKNYRKKIETAFSCITRLFPKAICAKSSRGFEVRILLFLMSYSISNKICKIIS